MSVMVKIRSKVISYMKLRFIKIFFSTLLCNFPSILGGRFVRSIVWRFCFKKSSGFVFHVCNISGFKNIELGAKCSFMPGVKLYSNLGKLNIGDNCNFNHDVVIDSSDGGFISIGNDVLIGPNVVMRASNHVTSDLNKPIRLQGHEGGKISIGSNVWIASNTCILSGANIGNGCIISAGSVVYGICKSNSVYGGNPARFLRYR